MTEHDDKPIEDVLQDLAKDVPDEEWAKLDDGGPAFPLCRTESNGRNDCLHTGMSLCQYAAIHLGVPRSGNDKVDAMIVESRRLDLAGLAMAAILHNDPDWASRDTGDMALEAADGVLTEWRKRNDDVQPGTESPADGGQPAPAPPV